MKIVIGPTSENRDWLDASLSELNPSDIKTYYRFLKRENIVDAFLLEHIIEHFTLEDAKTIAKNLYAFTKPGGYVRAAVPDALFLDPDYQTRGQIGGNGSGKDPGASHKVFYDYKTFSSIFSEAGFQVRLLEYFDESGEFHFRPWSKDDGYVERSLRYSPENHTADHEIHMLSIILDAKKSR